MTFEEADARANVIVKEFGATLAPIYANLIATIDTFGADLLASDIPSYAKEHVLLKLQKDITATVAALGEQS